MCPKDFENSQVEEDCRQNLELLEAEMNIISNGGPSSNLLQMDKRGFMTSTMGSIIRITGKNLQ